MDNEKNAFKYCSSRQHVLFIIMGMPIDDFMITFFTLNYLNCLMAHDFLSIFTILVYELVSPFLFNLTYFEDLPVSFFLEINF